MNSNAPPARAASSISSSPLALSGFPYAILSLIYGLSLITIIASWVLHLQIKGNVCSLGKERKSLYEDLSASKSLYLVHQVRSLLLLGRRCGRWVSIWYSSHCRWLRQWPFKRINKQDYYKLHYQTHTELALFNSERNILQSKSFATRVFEWNIPKKRTCLYSLNYPHAERRLTGIPQ